MRKYKKFAKCFSFEIFKDTFPFDWSRQNLYVMGLDEKGTQAEEKRRSFLSSFLID